MKIRIMVAVVCTVMFAHAGVSFSGALPCRDVRMEAADQGSGGSRVEDIEKKLKELLGELEKLQKDASEKIRKEVIPRLEKEIDRLKEWLRDFQSNPEKEPRTRET